MNTSFWILFSQRIRIDSAVLREYINTIEMQLEVRFWESMSCFLLGEKLSVAFTVKKFIQFFLGVRTEF